MLERYVIINSTHEVFKDIIENRSRFKDQSRYTIQKLGSGNNSLGIFQGPVRHGKIILNEDTFERIFLEIDQEGKDSVLHKIAEKYGELE